MPLAPSFIWNAASRLDPLYDAEDAPEFPVSLQGTSTGLTYPAGTVLGEVTATPGLFAPYDDAASDGTQSAKAILRYRAVVTGTTGAVGTATWVGGEWGAGAYSPTAVPAFMAGTFETSKLIGLDANGLADLAGSIREGALGVNESDSIAQTGGSGTWAFTIPAFTNGSTSYAAVTVSSLSATITAANFVIAVNAALSAAGVPAWVTATGGALGTNPIVAVWHGALGSQSITISIDNTGMSGGTVASTPTHGSAATGVVRIG